MCKIEKKSNSTSRPYNVTVAYGTKISSFKIKHVSKWAKSSNGSYAQLIQEFEWFKEFKGVELFKISHGSKGPRVQMVQVQVKKSIGSRVQMLLLAIFPNEFQ